MSIRTASANTWYISDLTKFKSHYPNWKITIGLDEIFRQIMADQRLRNVPPH
jgi:hypothetical protein